MTPALPQGTRMGPATLWTSAQPEWGPMPVPAPQAMGSAVFVRAQIFAP